MNADLLEETVLFMLNKELMLRGNAMRQKENLFSFQKAGIHALKRKLDGYRQEKKKVQAEKDALYKKYALKKLPVAEYQRKAMELTERISSLSVLEEETIEKLTRLEDECQKAETDMKQIIRYSHIEELTQEVVDAFIKRVYAYKDKQVEIEWNFSVDNAAKYGMGVSRSKTT